MCACVCGWSKKKEGYACCIVRVCIHTYIWRHKYWLMNVRGWAWSAPKAKGFARWKLLKTVGCCSTLYIIHTHTRGCIVHELIQYTSNGACLCNQCFAALQRKGGGRIWMSTKWRMSNAGCRFGMRSNYEYRSQTFLKGDRGTCDACDGLS